MAVVQVPDRQVEITDSDRIREFLAPFGIWFEHWPVEGRLQPDCTDEEILREFAPEVESLKHRGGFVTADVINVKPDTPGLDAMLEKFNKEHTHSEDEVRFTVSGRGVFHIHADNGEVFAIQVESGDLINVPRGTKHWFNLCDDRQIRCIRLFEDKAGWTPHYVEGGVHDDYQPLCLGPQYLSAGQAIKSVIQP